MINYSLSHMKTLLNLTSHYLKRKNTCLIFLMEFKYVCLNMESILSKYLLNIYLRDTSYYFIYIEFLRKNLKIKKNLFSFALKKFPFDFGA